MNQDLNGISMQEKIKTLEEELQLFKHKVNENDHKKIELQKEKDDLIEQVKENNKQIIISQNHIVTKAHETDIFTKALIGIAAGVGVSGIIILTGGLGIPAASACLLGLGATGGLVGAAVEISNQTLQDFNKLSTQEAMKDYCDKNQFKASVLCLSGCIAINAITLKKIGGVVIGSSDKCLEEKLGEGLKIDPNKLAKNDLDKFHIFKKTIEDFAMNSLQNRKQLLDLAAHLQLKGYADLSFNFYDQADKIVKGLELAIETTSNLASVIRIISEKQQLLQESSQSQRQLVNNSI